MEKLLKDRVKEEQPRLTSLFEKVLVKNTLTHAYLMESQEIDSAYDFSLWLAQSIFCEKKENGKPCGICNTCQRVISLDFPDVTTIEPDGQTIKVDQIRDIKQTFIRSGMESRKKALIIKSAEKMTVSAANSLLKFIEEPDGTMHIFFLTNNSNKILPTIQSRCQQVYLHPIAKSALVLELMKESSLPKKQIELIVELSESKKKAVELSSDEWFNSARETVSKWFLYLDKKNALAFIYVQQHLVKLVKDKEQQFLILDILLNIYRLELKEQIALDSIAQERYNGTIEKIINARKKLEANVSFQNVCEQLVWQVLY